MQEPVTPVVNADSLCRSYWKFHQDKGPVITEVFSFLPDGAIRGHDSDGERFWVLEDGVVSLLDRDHKPALVFDAVQTIEGRLVLSGHHIRAPKLTFCLTQQAQRPLFGTTRQDLKAEIERFGWEIGDHTYGTPSFLERGRAKFIAGKYCSIAAGVVICLGDHRTDTFTTYPFQALRSFWQNVPKDVADHVSKGDVVLGNDVWVGTRAFIGSGVTIGDGAVIGAHAVVTKDVPPYAVVAGNPARVLRHRFDDATIAALLEAAWWNLPDEAVDALIPLLMANDVATLLRKIKDLRSSAS